MADKKKGKKGKKGKKRSPNDGPSVNEIIIRKLLKLYDSYCKEYRVVCCPDVVRVLRAALDEDTEVKKVRQMFQNRFSIFLCG
jgi:hypothetical protein